MLIKERTIWTPDNSFLLRYRAEAETGAVIIGQELWQELDNLAEDMKNDRYIYDREDALLRMDFMQNCVRLIFKRIVCGFVTIWNELGK